MQSNRQHTTRAVTEPLSEPTSSVVRFVDFLESEGWAARAPSSHISALTDPCVECKDKFFLSASLSSEDRGGRRDVGMVMPGSMTYSPLIELLSLKRCK